MKTKVCSIVLFRAALVTLNSNGTSSFKGFYVDLTMPLEKSLMVMTSTIRTSRGRVATALAWRQITATVFALMMYAGTMP